MLMGYEITRDFPLEYKTIETPLQTMEAPKLAGKKVVIARIVYSFAVLFNNCAVRGQKHG